jgi:hypothetical protein
MMHAKVAPIVIAPRFCGPPQSGNGGYVCGRLAALADGVVTVRLRVPPPLELPMLATFGDGGRIALHAGEVLVAEAAPTQLDLEVRPPVSHEDAVAASERFVGYDSHPFGTCFVCGVQRARGDGLRIFAGPCAAQPKQAETGDVAAPWVPDASLCLPDGKVAAEFIWAALDCPGAFAAAPDGRPMLLAEFAARIDRPIGVGERCVVMGWLLRSDGRKHEVGTALFNEQGALIARARGLWIEPRRP